LQRFSGCEREIDKIAARMYENQTGSSEPLQNETLTAEEARAEFLYPCHGELNCRLSKKDGIALGEEILPWVEIKGLDAAGITAKPTWPGPLAWKNVTNSDSPVTVRRNAPRSFSPIVWPVMRVSQATLGVLYTIFPTSA
jgi:hypothetical protein